MAAVLILFLASVWSLHAILGLPGERYLSEIKDDHLLGWAPFLLGLAAQALLVARSWSVGRRISALALGAVAGLAAVCALTPASSGIHLAGYFLLLLSLPVFTVLLEAAEENYLKALWLAFVLAAFTGALIAGGAAQRTLLSLHAVLVARLYFLRIPGRDWRSLAGSR